MMQKYEDAGKALIYIYKQHGREVFEDSRKLVAYLSDYAPKAQKDRRRVKQLIESGALALVLKADVERGMAEVYLSKAVKEYIDYNDSEEGIAIQVVSMAARVFSLEGAMPKQKTQTSEQKTTKPEEAKFQDTSSQSSIDSDSDDWQDDNTDTDTYVNNAPSSRFRPLRIGSIILLAIIAVIIVIGVVSIQSYGIKTYIFAIAAGLGLMAISYGIAYAIEEIWYNEKYQTYTFIVIILTIANLIMQLVFKDKYTIYFHCIGAFLILGTVITSYLAFDDLEKSWGFTNVGLVIIGVVIQMLLTLTITWGTWQWLIGISGSLVLAAVIFGIGQFFEAYVMDNYKAITIITMFPTVINFFLMNKLGEAYFAIGACLALTMAIICIVSAIRAFVDIEVGFGFLSLLVAAINGAVFVVFVMGNTDLVVGKISELIDKKKTVKK